MGLKQNDLKDTILKKISLDEFHPKTGDEKDVAVAGFRVSQSSPGKDLYNFLNRSVIETRDIEVSPNANEEGHYMVFIEMDRNEKLLDNIYKMLSIINGQSSISLRFVDWFVTNYSKKHFVIYPLNGGRFKVYDDYKLKLRAYSKKRFDPFCRWERITIPYKNNVSMQTTIGQLNFFKWALENNIIDYIEKNYEAIEKDMNARNSGSKKNKHDLTDNKTRKKREELSISATKSIKKENVEIVVSFD